ncbi:tetratricopeptide repeat protein [Promethearchaeum syntrophicum]|uniref:Tetratricopeptide repeat protein n=1 Tax=Promethearchaeum syntrophicum TaxID=2594042 RepID=A0A5B9DEH8_9ARCH|nr:tetratricopeptide repeat protein [Candidatus Prometheoarchaeum syntrophicum]QEE17200.1 tetratricopeptide repeat protein [Candidatus Prometheoarchaeum syntrophicum]
MSLSGKNEENEENEEINKKINELIKKSKNKEIPEKFNFRFGENDKDNQFLSDYISRIPIIRQYRKPSTIKGWLRWGRDYLHRKNYTESQKCFENIIRIDSNHLLAHFYLGHIFFLQKSDEKSEKEFKICLNIDPNYAAALHMLGVINYEKKNHAEAISYFEKTHKLDPENCGTLEYWAYSLKNLGKNKEASKKIEKRNQILGLNDPLSVEAIIDKYAVLFKEEPDLRENILIQLNDLGWQFLSNELIGFSGQIAETMLKLAESIKNEKMICYAKDLMASTLTESDNLEDLREALSLFEDAKKVSETYYSPKIYQKAIKKIKMQDKKFEYNEETNENNINSKYENLRFEELPHYEDIIKFVDYPQENSLLRNFFHPQTSFVMAMSALQNKNTDFAEAVLKTLVSKDPNHYEAISVLASILMTKNELDGVEDMLLSAIKLKPDNIAIIVELGDLYQKLGFDFKAIPYYKILTKYDPNLRYYDIILGQMFFHEGNYEEALIHLKKGLQKRATIGLQSKSPILIPEEKIDFLQAQIYFHLNDFQSTEEKIKKILIKDPKNVFGLKLKLNLLTKQKKNFELRELYEKCIKLFPNDYKIWLNYGVFEFNSSEIDNSKQYFNQSLKLLDFKIQSQPYVQVSNEIKEDLSRVNFFLGRIFLNNGQYEKALNNLEQSLILSVRKDEIYLEIGLLEIQRSNYHRAVNYFLRGLHNNPDNHHLWFELGKLLMARGNSKDSELCLFKSFSIYLDVDTLQSLIKLDEKKYGYLTDFPVNGQNIGKILGNIDLCRKYGFFYFQTANYINAIKCFDQVLQENPNDLIILLISAETYLNLNQFQRALNIIEKIEKNNQDSFITQKIENEFYNTFQATLSLIKGKYYIYQFQYRKSILAFNKSISLNPKNWISYYYLGINYFILNDFKASKSNFEKVISIDSKIYLAEAHLGYISKILDHEELINQKKTVQKMKFYYDLKLFAPEVDALLDLEDLFGEEIPAISSNNPFSGMRSSTYHPFHFTLRDGHVIELAICGKKLTTLPDSIGNFSNLQKIDLTSNNLTEFPASFQKLRKLININLDYNKFEILPEYLFNFADLSFLSLKSNPIRGLDYQQLEATEPQRIYLWLKGLYEFEKKDEYQNLKLLSESLGLEIKKFHDFAEIRDNRVERLKLSNLNLETIPEMIFKFPNLHDLDLSKNSLTEIPEHIQKLKELRTLNLSSNKISSIPSCIDHLQSLAVLELWENPLLSLPESLLNMPNLVRLEINEKQCLSESLKNQFFQGMRLFSKDVQILRKLESDLGGLPDECVSSNFGRISSLYFPSLSLDSLPGYIDDLDALNYIHYGKNPNYSELEKNSSYIYQGARISSDEKRELIQLSKKVGEDIHFLDPDDYGDSDDFYFTTKNNHVTSITINKKLIGDFPKQILNFPYLQNLTLTEINIKKIPKEIQNLKDLRKMDLYSNDLSALPDSFANLQNLLTLNIGNNKFQILPNCLSELNKLYSLYIYGNPWNLDAQQIFVESNKYGCPFEEIEHVFELEIEKFKNLLRNKHHLRVLNDISTIPSKTEHFPSEFTQEQKFVKILDTLNQELVFSLENKQTIKKCIDQVTTNKQNSLSIFIDGSDWQKLYNHPIKMMEIFKLPIFLFNKKSNFDKLVYFNPNIAEMNRNDLEVSIFTQLYEILMGYLWNYELGRYSDLEKIWNFFRANSEILWIFKGKRRDDLMVLVVIPSKESPIYIAEFIVKSIFGTNVKYFKCSDPNIVKEYSLFKPSPNFSPATFDHLEKIIEEKIRRS